MKPFQMILALLFLLLVSSCYFIVDADELAEPPDFAYEPSNFNPSELRPSGPVVLDCAESVFDSSTESFIVSCPDRPMPTPQTAIQEGGADAIVLAMDGLTIAEGATLSLIGSRPVILAVSGPVTIAGIVNASADGPESGPGGSPAMRCMTRGLGGDGMTNMGRGGGGGGGGFGTAGAPGSHGGLAIRAEGGVEGEIAGEELLVPLRGGCPGGRGGAGSGGSGGLGGEAGGAVQISATGALEISETGRVAAAGEGGIAETNSDGSGGGGGGSGGAILLEARDIAIRDGAVVSANGGGGGGGAANDPVNGNESVDGEPGEIDSNDPASGGDGGPNDGKDGGNGGTGVDQPLAGLEKGGNGGGGGGGGAAGRIRLNARASCSINELAVLSAVATGGEECGGPVEQLSAEGRSRGLEAQSELQ